LAQELEQGAEIVFERLLVPSIAGGDAVEDAASSGQACAEQKAGEGPDRAPLARPRLHEAIAHDRTPATRRPTVLTGPAAAEPVERDVHAFGEPFAHLDIQWTGTAQHRFRAIAADVVEMPLGARRHHPHTLELTELEQRRPHAAVRTAHERQ